MTATERVGEPRLRNKRGATAVVVAVLIMLLFAFAALSIDVWHLNNSRSELQNAADACALRGAAMLYYDLETNQYVTTPQETANAQAYNAGIVNQAAKSNVEITYDAANNTGDIQRGHWNFRSHANPSLQARTFNSNGSTDPFQIVGAGDLDANLDFVNAVGCITHRETTPVTNFFAPLLNLFGGNFATTAMSARAVAYIGFTGSFVPWEIDQPIGVCQESITVIDPDTGEQSYNCNMGRMFNSTIDTSMWTNYGQTEPNCPGASANSIPIYNDCNNGNPEELSLGKTLDTTQGVQDNNFRDFKDCWLSSGTDADGDGFPDQPWEITLPVIDCSVGTCTPITGAVKVEVVAVVRDGKTNLGNADAFDETPHRMGDWVCSISPEDNNSAQHNFCWDELVDHFQLKKMPPGNAAAEYMAKSVYFKPSCDDEGPTGRTGGENYGLRAKYPALVE